MKLIYHGNICVAVTNEYEIIKTCENGTHILRDATGYVWYGVSVKIKESEEA